MKLSREIIKKCAEASGFDLCGVAETGRVDWIQDYFSLWCDKGYNAGMEWTLKNGELRTDPSLLLPETKSVICVGLSYLREKQEEHLALLYQGVDYHHLMKERMNRLVELLQTATGAGFNARVCVDSAPVFEKYWAVKAGLGWIGRNTLILNRNLGSFFVIGEIFIDQTCDSYDTEEPFYGCGQCRRCQKACPTSALSETGMVDARRCLSYLTIEHRNAFSEQQQRLIESTETNSYFGCDGCQTVCPWNKKALRRISAEKKEAVAALFRQTAFDFAPETLRLVTNGEFKKRYRSTALFRTSLKNILRNINAIL